jgi:hypothetical protein
LPPLPIVAVVPPVVNTHDVFVVASVVAVQLATHDPPETAPHTPVTLQALVIVPLAVPDEQTCPLVPSVSVAPPITCAQEVLVEASTFAVQLLATIKLPVAPAEVNPAAVAQPLSEKKSIHIVSACVPVVVGVFVNPYAVTICLWA